jgi:hypothetical protein
MSGKSSKDDSVDFHELEKPITHVVIYSRESSTRSTYSLNVAEPFRGAKATDGKGSTIDEALRAMATTHHSLIAFCSAR